MSMNLENFLSPRNVQKWERKGLIVIRFYGLKKYPASIGSFCQATAAKPTPMPG